MKYYILIAFTFCSFHIVGQEKFSKEVSLVTDNDLYISTKRDRYYTSGIFLNYRYLSNTKKNHIEKKILEISDKEISSREIGSMVMKYLHVLDPVAYVRFAAVYRKFQDVDEFVQDLIGWLKQTRSFT